MEFRILHRSPDQSWEEWAGGFASPEAAAAEAEALAEDYQGFLFRAAICPIPQGEEFSEDEFPRGPEGSCQPILIEWPAAEDGDFLSPEEARALRRPA